MKLEVKLRVQRAQRHWRITSSFSAPTWRFAILALGCTFLVCANMGRSGADIRFASIESSSQECSCDRLPEQRERRTLFRELIAAVNRRRKYVLYATPARFSRSHLPAKIISPAFCWLLFLQRLLHRLLSRSLAQVVSSKEFGEPFWNCEMAVPCVRYSLFNVWND